MRQEREVPAGAKLALILAVCVAPFIGPTWLRGARGIISMLPDRQESVPLAGVFRDPDNYKFVTVRVEGYYSPIEDPSTEVGVGLPCRDLLVRPNSYSGELREEPYPDSPAILIVGCDTDENVNSLSVKGGRVAITGVVKDKGVLLGKPRWILEASSR